MAEQQILEYIELCSRKMYILLHNGISWQPEYENELQQINQKLALLRPLVDVEHNRRKEDEKCLHLQM